VHAPCEDKSDDVKDSFYGDPGRVFYKIPTRNNMTILLGDFNAKLGRKDIFKTTNWNKSSHEIGDDNAARAVNVYLSPFSNLRLFSVE
jgi:hypothetical protein